jgi:hypothetical protein
VVICLTGLCGARRLGAGIELRLSLPAAHPVGSIDEFIRPHAEASIDKVFAVLLQDDNIVLLTQITYDLLNSMLPKQMSSRSAIRLKTSLRGKSDLSGQRRSMVRIMGRRKKAATVRDRSRGRGGAFG